MSELKILIRKCRTICCATGKPVLADLWRKDGVMKWRIAGKWFPFTDYQRVV